MERKKAALFKSVSTSVPPPLLNEAEMELGEAVGLSAYQTQLMSQIWPKLYGTGAGRLGDGIFSELVAKSSAAKDVFAKAAVREGFGNGGGISTRKEHGKWLMDLLDTAMNSFQQPARAFINQAQEIGHKHRVLRAERMGNGTWEELADAIIERMRKYEAVRKHRELGKGFMLLVTFTIHHLKAGFNSSHSPPSLSPASPPVSQPN